MKDIYMIGNTHFDPVWLWRWDEAMTSIHATFRSALDRMNEDPEFRYSFATPPVFDWIYQIDPDMMEEIKARVKEGRWEVCEGWWLQPDCYSGCGESYARQGLYGQRYLMEHFGVFSDVVFNIDSFGHTSATPQLLKKIHVDKYCLVRPEPKHVPLAAPYFKWVGNDGSEVRAFRAGQYSEVYNKDMEATVAAAEVAMADAPCDELMVFGVTDHGGAPTKKAIADIHRLNDEKPYTLKMATVTEYFDAQDEPTVTHKGELLTRDFGPYANHHGIKRRNRLGEYAMLNAERASILAKHMLERPYEKAAISQGWKDVMFNQFHDILGGASIQDAYFDAYNQQGRAIATAKEITHFRLQAITKKMKTLGTNPENPWNVVAWNLNDQPYNGYIEAELQWLHEFPAYEGAIELEDETGKRYPCQIIDALSVIPGFRSRIVFQAEIPAMGCRSFKAILTGELAAIRPDTLPLNFDTPALTAQVDKATGRITVTRKDTGFVYNTLAVPACYADEGDTWCFNIEGYGEKLEDCAFAGLSVVEAGCHRTVLKADYTFRKSLLTLYYTFYTDSNAFDVRYKVNWNEKHIVAKLLFDTGCSHLLASSPYSVEDRPDNPADQPMSEWLWSGDDAQGLGIACDSVFAYGKKDSLVSLTMLRSCIYGDLRMGELDPGADHDILEQGICEGTVRLLLTGGDALSVPAEAAALNNPPIVIIDANHDGIFPSVISDFTLIGRGITLGALKQWEDGEQDVLRLAELFGNSVDATLTWQGKRYTIPMAPHEIKTLLVTDEGLTELWLTEEAPMEQ